VDARRHEQHFAALLSRRFDTGNSHGITHLRYLLLAAALLLFVCAASGQVVSTSPLQNTNLSPQLPSLTVIAPPDATLVRINGSRAMTERVFPALVNRSRLFDRDLAIIDGWNVSRDVPGARITLSAWVSDLRLRVPVDADDLVANIVAAPAGEARFNTAYHFDKARLSFKFNVRSTTDLEALRALSTVMQRMATIEDSFAIEMFGVRGSFDFATGVGVGRIRIQRIDRLTVQLDGVIVEDTGWLTEIANFFLGFDRVFNVTGAANVNQAASLLANRLLQETFRFRSLLQDNVNYALWTLGTPQFGMHAIPLPRGATLGISGTLRSLSSATDVLRLDWDTTASAQPDGAVPTLAYSKLVRVADDLAQIPAAGDLQLFAPYSLVDQALFELVQAGLLQGIGVPPATQGGIGQGFLMTLVPTSMPRTYRDSASPGRLVVRVPVRMENAAISSSGYYGPEVPEGLPTSLSVSITNAAASLAVYGQPLVRTSGLVDLRVLGVTVSNVTGEVRVGTTVTSLAPHQGAIQSAIDAAVRRFAPTIPLVTRAISLPEGFSVSAGAATLGSAYAWIPVTVAVN
jgi:hypothetical protein